MSRQNLGRSTPRCPARPRRAGGQRAGAAHHRPAARGRNDHSRPRRRRPEDWGGCVAIPLIVIGQCAVAPRVVAP